MTVNQLKLLEPALFLAVYNMGASHANILNCCGTNDIHRIDERQRAVEKELNDYSDEDKLDGLDEEERILSQGPWDEIGGEG